jgi:hypothetical protein
MEAAFEWLQGYNSTREQKVSVAERSLAYDVDKYPHGLLLSSLEPLQFSSHTHNPL